MAMMRLEEPSSRELGSSWGPRRGLSARVAMVLTFALPCAARVSPACGPVPPQREEDYRHSRPDRDGHVRSSHVARVSKRFKTCLSVL